MQVSILFGTETGNAEMAADEIQSVLEDNGHRVVIEPMDSYDIANLGDEEFVVLVTSTYGEGELPATAAPFYDSLVALGPDLAGCRFAGFGLGDSSYETYNNAVDIMTAKFVELGAAPIGAVGRHDANSGLDLDGIAGDWAKALVGELGI